MKEVVFSSLFLFKVAHNIYVYGSAKEAKDPGKLGRVDSNEFSGWVSQLYPKQKYPAMLVGSSNGAVIHLGAALGIPWLPQTFLIPVKTSQGLGVDEPIKRMEWAHGSAKKLLESNPLLQLHHMMDTNQGRPMLKKTSYFRVKQLRLTKEYWDCPKPTDKMPESEWGFEPALQEDIVDLTRRHGFRAKRIAFDEPEDPSPLVAELYRLWNRERGISHNQLLIGTFFLIDPY